MSSHVFFKMQQPQRYRWVPISWNQIDLVLLLFCHLFSSLFCLTDEMHIIIWVVFQTVHHLSEVWVNYKVLPTFHKEDEKIEDRSEGSTRAATGYGESLPAEPLSTRRWCNQEITTASSLIYIARNSMYVETHIHVAYEICENSSTWGVWDVQ
jgi:hypothetical protein